jgi:hypothetical protein
LLRFLKGLNQLFNAFLDSIPKLINVASLLALMMLLFGVMGVNMFAKIHFHGPHNVHANFSDFGQACMTLLRCMTGEGWNEIMHSVIKPAHYFGQATLQPCIDYHSFGVDAENYDAVNERCLIQNPLGCGEVWFGVSFFIVYTCVITFIILNLFVAVVLEGFDGTTGGDENLIVEKCCEVWRRYDRDLTLRIPMLHAAPFIEEVQSELGAQLQGGKQKSIPMRNAYFVLGHMQLTGSPPQVSFANALEGALRLILSNGDHERIRELSAVVDEGEEPPVEEEMPMIVQEMAALRMQDAFRRRKEARAREAAEAALAESGAEAGMSELERALPGAVTDEEPAKGEEPEKKADEETGGPTADEPVNLNQGDMPKAG